MPLSLERTRHDDQSTWVLSGEWSDHDAAMYAQSDVRRLEVNHAKGFQGTDLRFLASTPDLTHLTVIDPNLTNFAGIESLEHLEYLSVQAPYDGILPFAHNPGLRHVALNWRPGARDLLNVESLERLYLDGLPPSEDFAFLGSMPWLRHVELSNSRRLRSLAGIARLTGLEFLGTLQTRPRVVERHRDRRRHLASPAD